MMHTSARNSVKPVDESGRAALDSRAPWVQIRRVCGLAGAVALSVAAVGDAIGHGVTGHSMMPDDQTGPIVLAVEALHGLTYAALCWVLNGEASRLDAGSSVRRWIRRLLVADLAILSAVFLVALPAIDLDPRPVKMAAVEAAVGAVASIAFLAMFVLTFALGVATLRQPGLRPASYLMIAILPGIGLVLGLTALGSDFAHPGYAEALVYISIALLARRPRRAAAPE